MKARKGVRLFGVILVVVAITPLILFMFSATAPVVSANGYPYQGSGTPGDPYIVENLEGLDNIRNNLSAHYALGCDIDASDTRYWNDNGDGGYYGFVPIGTETTPFTGSLDGRGHKISNLYINRPDKNYVGLFGFIAKTSVENAVLNLGLDNENITGSGFVGGLAGVNDNGIIDNCYATGPHLGGDEEYAGGLVGYNSGLITNCYSTFESVIGNYDVGGLVGRNEENIENCYAVVEYVVGISNNDYFGGLVGTNYDTGSIRNCHAEIKNVGGNNNYVGGLVGWNDGEIDNCYATVDNAAGNDYVGGLVGFNSGWIDNCNATGDNVTGKRWVGGLVGLNNDNIEQCHADLYKLVGENFVGGLVGSNVDGEIVSCHAHVDNVAGIENVGGLIGFNSGYLYYCYATGCVYVNPTIGKYTGGLVGYNEAGLISNCYSIDNMLGNDYYGGLVGLNNGDIVNCYSVTVFSGGDDNFGGLVGGSTGGIISNSFWDNETSGKSTSAGGTGKTTENMKNVRTYTDTSWSTGLDTPWDFIGNPYEDIENANIWKIGATKNDGYPILWWQNAPPTAPTSLTLPSSIKVTQTLTATASGSTDPDNDSITYLYMFYNVTDAAVRRDWSDNNSYVITSSDAHDNIAVYVRASDNIENSADLENCILVGNFAPVAYDLETEGQTNPTNLTTYTPTFTWEFSDMDGDGQVQRQIQVGTSQNGNDMWDSTLSTSSQSAVYAGSTLSRGVTYYWRVKVYD
ncbi:MAG: GLUG motif-containing protein, partial [Candidatus Hadarchaeales archaeon]